MPKSGKRAILILAVAAVLILAAVVYYAVYRHSMAGVPFPGDGYVLHTADDQVERVYFAGDAAYRAAYPAGYRFNDVQGNEVAVSNETFLHYSNEAIGATTDGILLDIETLNQTGLTPFYRLSTDTVITRGGDGTYQVEGANGEIPIGTVLYKLSDTTYLICSDRMTLQLSEGNTVEVEDYIEISYVDESVIKLVSSDQVWYTIATDAEIITKNGIRCCLADKRVRDAEDNVLMKLSEVLLDTDAAIEVLPGEDIEWIVPRFDITTIDGDPGAAGDDGLEGEQGAEGTTGNDGEEGDGGTGGTSGSAGAPGAIGATGGTAGSSGDEGIVLPDFLLSEFDVSDTGFTGKLSVTDSEDRLRDDDEYNKVFVVELATGRETLVESSEYRSATDTYSFTMFSEGGIELTGLKTNTRYRLVVRSTYDVDGTEYQRVFISKEFMTDSMGLELREAYVTATTATVRLTKKEYSAAAGASLVLYRKDAFISASSDSGKVGEINPNRDELKLSGMDFTFFDPEVGITLTPDTEYVVVLKGLINGVLVPSEEHLIVKTLKRMPEIGVPLVVIDQRSSVFNITPEIISDPDLSITKYTYEIYNAMTNTVVTSVSTDSALAYTLPIDGLRIERDVLYKTRLKVLAYDNEKTVELISDFSNEFIMRGTGYPFISFSYVTTYVDGNGNTQTLSGNQLSGFSNVNGMLSIDFNGADVIIDQSEEVASNPLKMRITSLDQYEEVRLLYVDDLGQRQYENGFLEIPIIRRGLKADATYLISVYGTVDLGDGRGAQSDFLIGNSVFQTSDVPALKARWTEPTQSSNTALAVYFSLEPDTGVPLKDATQAANTLTRMEFNLYSGASTNGTPIGTYVLDDTDPAYFASSIGEATFNNTTGSGILITEREFGLEATQLPSAVTIVVSDAMDYTYTGTSQTIAGRDHNATTSGYINHIPITNNSTTIVKANTPPEIPLSDPLNVLRITNAEAANYHLTYNDKLEPTTTIGFKLMPNYANDQALTRSITYYVYENDAFAAWKDAAAAPRPGGTYETDGGVTTLVPASAGSTSAANGFIGQVTVSGISTASLDDAYAVILLAGTTLDTSDGFTAPENYLFLGDKFTGEHQSKYGSYGADLAWGRGWDYAFAYDAMISLTGATAIGTHRFPYENADYDASGIKLLFAHLQASFQAPVLRSYPYTSHMSDGGTPDLSSTWKYCLTDIDGARLPTNYFRVTKGSVSDHLALDISPVDTPVFSTCRITCAAAPTSVSTQVQYRQLYSQSTVSGYATLDGFSYTQRALGSAPTGITIEVDNRLSTDNQIILTLSGEEKTLRALAGLRVVVSSGGTSTTVYPRLTTYSGAGSAATATAYILSSQLKALPSGNATLRFFALYDSEITGYNLIDNAFFAIQVNTTGGLSDSMYLVPSNNNAMLIASYDGANNSLFRITDFVPQMATNIAEMEFRSLIGQLTDTLHMDLTAKGTYMPGTASWRLTPKLLREVEITSVSGGSSVPITTPVPFVNLNYTADIIASIDRVTFTYRIEGATAGTLKDDTVYMSIYEKDLSSNNYTLLSTTPRVIDNNDLSVYTETIAGLSMGREYRLEFSAYLETSGGGYGTTPTLLLREVGDEIQKAKYEFSTVSEVNITDITHRARSLDYSTKTLTLSYRLDRTFGFHIEINLEKWNPTGGTNGTGAFEPYKTYDELYNDPANTLPQQYASNQLYSSEMTCAFNLTAGSLIEPGGRYRFEIVAIANQLDVNGDEVTLGTAYHQYQRPAATSPIFSIMSSAKYTAPAVQGDPGNHAITFTIMPNDSQKVIVDGTYVLRLFKNESGVLTPVNIGVAGDPHFIGRAYTFTANNLDQGTDYTLCYYAVTDMNNTGKDENNNALVSISSLLDGLTADEIAALLRPVSGMGVQNPYLLGTKVQKTLGESGVEFGMLSVAPRPGTTDYLRLMFTDAYGIASVDETTPGPIVRMEYMIATGDLDFNESRVDTCPQITLLSSGITSIYVYNFEPQLPAVTGEVYYITVRLFTADGGDTPVLSDTLLYVS